MRDGSLSHWASCSYQQNAFLLVPMISRWYFHKILILMTCPSDESIGFTNYCWSSSKEQSKKASDRIFKIIIQRQFNYINFRREKLFVTNVSSTFIKVLLASLQKTQNWVQLLCLFVVMIYRWDRLNHWNSSWNMIMLLLKRWENFSDWHCHLQSIISRARKVAAELGDKVSGIISLCQP